MEVEGGEEDEEEDSPNESDFADSDQEIEGEELMELNEEGVLAKAKKDGPAPTITELREKLQKRIADIQAKKKEAAGAGGGATKRKAQPTKGADADDEDEEEDDDGTASVKSKDDLLEERKRRAALRDNRRKKRKEQKKNEKSDGSKKRAIEPSNGRAGGGKVNAPVRGAEAERPRKKVRVSFTFLPSFDLIPVLTRSVYRPTLLLTTQDLLSFHTRNKRIKLPMLQELHSQTSISLLNLKKFKTQP